MYAGSKVILQKRIHIIIVIIFIVVVVVGCGGSKVNFGPDIKYQRMLAVRWWSRLIECVRGRHERFDKFHISIMIFLTEESFRSIW